ncbi:unnamed protein product [Closterium sp. NIES-64]|nr:unnamed protein product [Closterium sp. NIES-64]
MASSPDSSSTVVRRQQPTNSRSAAAARARTSPRPVLPQPSPPGSASTRDEPSSSSESPRPPLPRVAVPTFPESRRPQGQKKRVADGETPSPRHRMTKKVVDDVNDLVDDELVVNPFYAEAPVPAEDDAAEEAEEAAAAAEEEDWNAPVEDDEAGECNEVDDDWWRPGRYDGEECDEWHAGDDEEEE